MRFKEYLYTLGPRQKTHADGHSKQVTKEWTNHTVHDSYESGIPTPLSALKIFNDEWVSAIPGAGVGTVPLFQDGRVEWAIDRAGGVAGKKILELGPLEGAHTYMLSRAGAASVLALEANTRCFLKCLVVKEVLEMQNTRFQFGDFVPWLENNEQRFDYIHAAGVLYHTINPVTVLNAICKATDQIYLWTHYADIDAMPTTDARYVSGIVGVEMDHAHGVDYKLYRRKYPTTPSTDPKFCGGVHKDPAWLEKWMILHVLSVHGFKTEIAHDVPDHQNGPCFSVFAQR